MTTLPPSIITEWIELRSKRGRLVCRIDRRRGLLEWRQGDDTLLVDLVEVLSGVEGDERQRGSA